MPFYAKDFSRGRNNDFGPPGRPCILLAVADSLKNKNKNQQSQIQYKILQSWPSTLVHSLFSPLIHNIMETNVRWPTLSNRELRPNQPYRNLTSNPVTFATTAKLVHASQPAITIKPPPRPSFPLLVHQKFRTLYQCTEHRPDAQSNRKPSPAPRTPAREANTTCRPATDGTLSRWKQRRKPASPQRSSVDDDAPARTEGKKNARQPPVPIAGSIARSQCTPQARTNGQLSPACDLPENDRACLRGTHAQSQAERDTQRPAAANTSLAYGRAEATRGRISGVGPSTCGPDPFPRRGSGLDVQRRRPDPGRRGAIRWPARAEGTVHRPVRERWTGVADPVAPAGHCFGSPSCVKYWYWMSRVLLVQIIR